jgi:uncharacterized protein (TIGR00297 family)
MTPVVAALIAATGALAGWRAGWLTPGAALAATAVGAAVGAGGGIPGLACLAMFFVSSSLLSGRDVAGSRRGAVQVLANGWAAAAGGLLTAVAPTAGWGLMVGGLAAAQADTWATEWGRRSARPPRMITTGRPVLVGTSGAVSLPGTAGGVAGAATLALLAWMLGLPVPAPWMAGAGIAGMLVDSVLGATVQARRTCTVCGRAVEWPRHCDAATTRVGGLRWVTNDTVNALATGAGAAIAACAAVGWQPPG